MSGRIHIDVVFETDARTTDQQFEEYLDSVMDRFDDLGIEADYLAGIRRRTATWSLPIRDLSEDALIDALGDMRRAMHGRTPAWLGRHEILAARCEPERPSARSVA